MPVASKADTVYWRGRSKRQPSEIPVAALYIVLGISAILLVIGAMWKLFWVSSNNTETAAAITIMLGFAGLGGYLFLAQHRLLFEDWISGNALILEQSFLQRDRRGKRLPARSVRKRFRETFDSPTGLSDCDAIALTASGSITWSRDSVLIHAGATNWCELVARPECTILTKIDFIENGDTNTKRAAAESLPAVLWPRAIEALLNSKQPEGRIAAIRLSNIPRRAVMKVCLKDRDASARRVAWEKIAPKLSPREARLLSKSSHPDIRLFALRSGKLSRKSLIRHCRHDDDPTLRLTAWEQIEDRLTSAQAVRLLQSPHEDTRRRVMHSSLLSRRLLAQSCSKDKDSSLREAAWEQIRHGLTRSEATRLSRSKHTLTRLWAIGSGILSRWRLFWLSRTDKNFRVKNSAREQRRARSRARRRKP